MDLTSLSYLIGSWQTEGRVLTEGENPATHFSGTDTYEWILNDQFILHKVDVIMGNAKVEAVEFIGEYDKADHSVKMHSFDSKGNYSLMRGQLEESGVLKITGDKMRAVLKVVNDQEMNAAWEKSADNKSWSPWMELKLTRK